MCREKKGGDYKNNEIINYLKVKEQCKLEFFAKQNGKDSNYKEKD